VVLLFGAEALVDAMLWPAGGAKGWMPGCVGMGRGTFQVVPPLINAAGCLASLHSETVLQLSSRPRE